MKKGFNTTALGIMSGTSLDGLDLCYAVFEYDDDWSFRITSTQCVEYDAVWREKLGTAHQLAEAEREDLHEEFGQLIGQKANAFLKSENLPLPVMVCSHGHTVLHQPEKGITLQIGNGQTIADTVGTTCISDFRSLDVSLGGEGAPLVPIGDLHLFSEYGACLNLGGFSNISFDENGKRMAFDICPLNIVLNELANEVNQEYDDGGNLARSGNLDQQLLEALNGMEIYQAESRPSLAREWVENSFNPILNDFNCSVADTLRTVTEHAAVQIGHVLNSKISFGSILVTGGGAKNDFLIERIASLSESEIHIPETQIVDFKEALIFAFLGVLRNQNQLNVLQSVTGATRDSSSGTIHQPSA